MEKSLTARVQHDAVSSATGKSLPAVGRAREELYFAAENSRKIAELKASDSKKS